MLCICFFGPCNNASWWACCASECFRLRICKVSSESGSIPLFILLVNKRSAPFALLFCISCLNFDESFSIFIWLFVDGHLSWMVLFSFTSSVMFPSYHNLSLLSNAFRWSFAFNVLLGFCRSSAGITWIAFSAIFLSGVLFVHRFRSLEISSINFLPAAPVGTIKIFLHQ